MHPISDTWLGNSFFTAQQGWVSLARQAVASGDCYRHFFGAFYPFALQRILHDAKCRILGRAYVDGLMDGEVFDLHDFEKRGYETFTVCIVIS